MQIVDFQPTSIRVGRWPVSVDVQCEADHSDNGISATFHTQRLVTVRDHQPHVEIRKLKHDIKVFAWKWDGHPPITGRWADSELIWTNMPKED